VGRGRAKPSSRRGANQRAREDEQASQRAREEERDRAASQRAREDERDRVASQRAREDERDRNQNSDIPTAVPVYPAEGRSRRPSFREEPSPQGYYGEYAAAPAGPRRAPAAEPPPRRPVAIVNIVPPFPDEGGEGNAGTLECMCARLDQRLRGVELALAAISRCMQQCHADTEERLQRLERCG